MKKFNKIKQNVAGVLDKPNEEFPRITMMWRFILLPLMIIWWFLQLLVFSGFGGIVCAIIAFVGFFSELGKKSEDRDFESGLFMLLTPIIAPFVWWIRYFKFGEYNPLF